MEDELRITLGRSRSTVSLRVTAEDLIGMSDDRLVVRPEDVTGDAPGLVWVTVDLHLAGWVPARVTPPPALAVGDLRLQAALPAQVDLVQPAWS